MNLIEDIEWVDGAELPFSSVTSSLEDQLIHLLPQTLIFLFSRSIFIFYHFLRTPILSFSDSGHSLPSHLLPWVIQMNMILGLMILTRATCLIPRNTRISGKFPSRLTFSVPGFLPFIFSFNSYCWKFICKNFKDVGWSPFYLLLLFIIVWCIFLLLGHNLDVVLLVWVSLSLCFCCNFYMLGFCGLRLLRLFVLAMDFFSFISYLSLWQIHNKNDKFRM